MYKNILVAYDGSETSDLAVKEAIKFAKENPKVFLRIVHVIDKYATPLYVNYAIHASALTEHEKLIEKSANTLLQKVGTDLKTAHISNFDLKLIEINNQDEHISSKIINEAKQWPSDLIIIGTHGRKGFHRFFLGSVAEGVSRIATIPVLLIRGKEI